MALQKTARSQFVHESASLADTQKQEHSEAVSEEACFFFSSLDLMAVINFDGDFKRVNPAFIRALGYSEADLVNSPFLPLVHPDDRPATLAEVEKLHAGVPTLYFENRYQTKAGDYRWLGWTASPRVDRGVIYCIARDMTQQKQAEAERWELEVARQQANQELEHRVAERTAQLEQANAALRESREILQRQLAELEVIYQSAPIGLNVLDADFRFVRINQRLAEMNGIPVEAHIGRSVRELLPEIADAAEQILRSVLETGEPRLNVELTGATPAQPGIQRVWLESFLPVKEGNRVIGISTVCEEITERKRVEQNHKRAKIALQEHTEHIQLLYETTRDLLSTEQPLTLIETLFAKLKCLAGLDAYINYVIDENLEKLKLTFYGGISEDTAREIEWLDVGCAVCGTVAKYGTQIVKSDLQHSDDPTTRHVRSLGLTAYACQPLIAQGKLFGTLSFGSRSRTDFTITETRLFQALCDQIAIALERSQLVTSLQRQAEDLLRANHIKDEFLAVLSHELRTPLNPILGWSKLLQSPRTDAAKLQHGLTTIERNAKQQVQLIDDLLDISRIIRGKLSLTFEPISLSVPILAAVETVRLTAEAKGIELEVWLNAAVGTIRGDTSRLQQVIWNLLSNAVKFTPSGGQVTVELSQQGEQAQIRIRDTGKGIQPEFLPHVFELFQQQDSSITRSFGGLGLGLAIARQVVEAHGGSITAASAGEGQGTTMTVQLPLMAGSTPAAPTAPPQPAFNLANLRVIAVDDEADSLDLVRVLLEQEGAIVTTVSSAAEALQTFAHDQFDLLISDIGMANMDGCALIREIRALSSNPNCAIPAVALTAYAGESNQRQMLAAGFQAHLAKPVEPQQLLAEIAALVRQ
ncbi:MAG TPA: ATP-binding protein [Trichocoleus sp.]